jgi:hypothetical protein
MHFHVYFGILGAFPFIQRYCLLQGEVQDWDDSSTVDYCTGGYCVPLFSSPFTGTHVAGD